MRETSFGGRAAWAIETDDLRVTLLQSGGHLAEIVLTQGEPVSPLWVQSRLVGNDAAAPTPRFEAMLDPGS